jgi:hypothetical protein
MIGWFLVRISGILVGFGILAVAFWGFIFLTELFWWEYLYLFD